jgi:hypothetical protein
MPPALDRSPWYRSFYWRIGVSFLALVVAVIVGQSVMFTFMMRAASTAPPPPHLRAAAIATNLGRALQADPGRDVGAMLRDGHRDRQRIYFVSLDGAVAGNTSEPLAEDMKRSALTMLGVQAGATPENAAATRSSGPVVTAPVQVSGALRGIVVMPPPPMPGLSREVGRLLSLPARSSSSARRCWRRWSSFARRAGG